MDQDVDETVNVDITLDEDDDTSPKYGTEEKQDSVQERIRRISMIKSDKETSNTTFQTSPSIDPSTCCSISRQMYSAKGTDISRQGDTDFRSQGTISASCSGRLTCTSTNLTSMTSNAEKTFEKAIVTPGSEITMSSPVPSCSGLKSILPVGGSVSTNTALRKRQFPGKKRTWINLSKTEIRNPTAVSIGGDVHVWAPPHKKSKVEAEDELTQSLKLKIATERSYKKWTEGMIMTKAATTILNKINSGKAWVTVTGCPGEGKTTAAYLVLKRLNDMGREVFDIKTPEDYFKVRGTNQCVVMLNDIFGALSYDHDSMKKWQNVLADVLALPEHSQDHRDKSNRARKKIPELSVILICRLSILKEASEDMGRYKHLVMNKESRVHLTKDEQEISEMIKIWNCHAERYHITIDKKIVTEMCYLDLSHGFAHCCRLFAAMYSENSQLDMKHFFSKPLDFLNESMKSLMRDAQTGPLLREMLKNDGSLDLEGIDDLEKQYQYSFSAKSLQDTYLTLNGGTVEFHHPSVYDSAAFVICQTAPAFVMSQCSMSFLNERVRLKALEQPNTLHTHTTLLVDCSVDTLLKRFKKEFENRNIAEVFSHYSFWDKRFVASFMENITPSPNNSKHIQGLFSVRDKESNKSFLFLMTKGGSDKILRYIHEYVLLKEEELSEALFGACEHSSVTSLEFLILKYRDINMEVTDSDNQTPLLISTQTRSPDFIRKLLVGNVNVNKSDNQGRTPLLNICIHGLGDDGSVVKMLIEKGADLTVKSQNDCDTPLHLACYGGHIEVASQLLDKGADVNTTNKHGDTPTHLASSEGHVDVLTLLRDNGADLNQKNTFGGTPLHEACFNGQEDVVLLLLKMGALINGPVNDDEEEDEDYFYNTPLHQAIDREYADIVSILLKNDADVNVADSTGETCLEKACFNGDVKVVKLLLDEGADIFVTDEPGHTPLHIASQRGHVEIVSLLLHEGADIDACESGEAPLHVACYGNYDDEERCGDNVGVVSLLLDKGAFVNSKEMNGYTPLHCACWNDGHVDVVPLLLEEGALVDEKDSYGYTPLHFACGNGYVNVVPLLLNKGASVNVKVNKGYTPLHFACGHGHVNVVPLLLDKGASVNVKANDGYTPLHWACENGHVDVVPLLLDKGASVNVKANDGYTPLHYACGNGHAEVVQLLLDKGAFVNAKDNDGNTSIHYACENGHVEVVSRLQKNGADINTTNGVSDTPLHAASRGGKADVVSLLINEGADVTITNNAGETALQGAQRLKHAEVIKLLQEKRTEIQKQHQDRTPISE